MKLKIGLLICDEAKTSIEHDQGSYPDMFRKLFKDYPKLKLVPFDMRKFEEPEDLDSFDGFVSTGSSYSVYDEEDWIKHFENLVQEMYHQGSKFFGVCFGHQMMAQALGGEVIQADAGWMIGVKNTEVKEDKVQPWMKSSKFEFQDDSPERVQQLFCVKAISSHKDQVVKLPPDGEILGSYPDVPIAMMKVGDNFIGFQGHPEFLADYAKPLAISRKEIIPNDILRTSLPTFAEQPDQERLASWMVRFFQS